jgi:hypothetical protein
MTLATRRSRSGSAGAAPKEVAARAGHTSVRVVLDVYGGLYPESDVVLRERHEAAYEPPAGEVVALDLHRRG